MKTWTKQLLAVAALAALAGCGSGDKAVEIVPAIRPVYTFTVQDPRLGREREFSGTARAAVESEISFRVAGKIVELPIKLGMSVKTGDLLARLDPSDYELQVKQSEAQVSQTEAMLKQARAQYIRVQELYESENASKSDLDTARASSDSCQAQAEAAVKALELARLQLSYCELTSPLDGQIASRPVDIHQTVAAGQTIATLSASGAMEVQISVPESLINAFQMGAPAAIFFDALPGQRFEGSVSEVGVRAESMGSFTVKLRILGDAGQVRPGMIGKVQVALNAGTDEAMIVPLESVVSGADGRHFVWVFKPGTQTVEQRFVTVGDLTPAGLQVVSGLSSGERIVTRGVHRMTDGMQVRPLDQDQSGNNKQGV